MNNTAAWIAMLILVAAGEALAADSGTQKKDTPPSITIEDIGKGLKSAEQNIEKEIPKIGPAIGETFKKLGGKKSDTPSDQKSSTQNK
jgi:hypothetical protein